LGDQQYRDPYGQAGRFQLQHKVYGRAGLPCLSCGTPIQRLQLGAKSAYLCRKCQR
jgi:formamidopyrimidine-DNA glycosylase